MSGKVTTVAFTLPKLTAMEKAEFAIQYLRQRREFCSDFIIGGPTPEEMIEENRRKHERFMAERLKIIKEHGVVKEYLKPLLDEKTRLEGTLALLQKEIDDLQRVQ
ncbi:MAG: hypothetical protein AAB472_01715 [Patescibacteria group bacterium]